jgi:Txe/YoeB family toxin of Txe-Axe toxin-antitoxin module
MQINMSESDYNYWNEKHENKDKKLKNIIKELENENHLLRRAIIDLTIKNLK